LIVDVFNRSTRSTWARPPSRFQKRDLDAAEGMWKPAIVSNAFESSHMLFGTDLPCGETHPR